MPQDFIGITGRQSEHQIPFDLPATKHSGYPYQKQQQSRQQKKIKDGEQLLNAISPFKFAFREDCALDRWAPPSLVALTASDQQLTQALPYLRPENIDIWASSYARAFRQKVFPKKKKTDTGQTGQTDNPDEHDANKHMWTFKPGLWLLAIQVQDKNCPLVSDDDTLWFAYVSMFRYTMCFVPLELKNGWLQTNLPLNFLDLNAIVRQQHPLALNESKSIGIYSLHVSSAAINFQCAENESAPKEALVPQQEHQQAKDACVTGSAICVCKPASLEDADAFLFKLTGEVHPSCPKKRTTSSRTKKTKQTDADEDGDSASNADDEAARAALELQGGFIPEGSDREDLANESDDDLVNKQNVDVIKQFIKSGNCPPEAVIEKLSESIALLPQCSHLSKEELHEEALLMFVKGLESPANVSQSAEDKSDQPQTKHGIEPSHDVSKGAMTNELKDDAEISGATALFRECRASKASGPASVPAGKDFCKRRGIHLKSTAKEAFSCWKTEVTLSVKALSSVKSTPGADQSEHENISLILIASLEDDSHQHEAEGEDHDANFFKTGSCEVMWVHWIKHKVNVVRQVNLDHRGGVIFSMAFAFPEINLKKHSWQIIVEDCAVPMLKVRQSERSVVPEHLIRLSLIYEQLIHQCVCKVGCLQSGVTMSYKTIVI